MVRFVANGFPDSTCDGSRISKKKPEIPRVARGRTYSLLEDIHMNFDLRYVAYLAVVVLIWYIARQCATKKNKFGTSNQP